MQMKNKQKIFLFTRYKRCTNACNSLYTYPDLHCIKFEIAFILNDFTPNKDAKKCFENVSNQETTKSYGWFDL